MNGPWGKMSARERGRLVSKLADRLMEKADEVARLETQFNPAEVPVETVAVKPRKADIAVDDVALVWVP